MLCTFTPSRGHLRPPWTEQAPCQGLYWLSEKTNEYQPLSLSFTFFSIDSGPPGSCPLKDLNSSTHPLLVETLDNLHINIISLQNKTKHPTHTHTQKNKTLLLALITNISLSIWEMFMKSQKPFTFSEEHIVTSGGKCSKYMLLWGINNFWFQFDCFHIKVYFYDQNSILKLHS